MIRKLVVAATLLAFAPAVSAQVSGFPQMPAPGESQAAKVLKEFGLLGDFAADCSKAPVGGQGHTTYKARPDGMVDNEFNIAVGPQGLAQGAKAKYLFLDARLASPTEIKIRAFTHPSEGEVEVTMIKGEQGFRLVSSKQLSTGKFLIQNSQHRGYTYKWVKRCDGGVS